MKNKIKLFDVHRGIKEEKSILNVLRSGNWASGSGTGKVAILTKDELVNILNKEIFNNI